MPNITLSEAVIKANVLKPFKAATVFAENVGKFYVIYSYNKHWPLYIYDHSKDIWYQNIEQYSITTSKHSKLFQPPAVTLVPRETDAMLKLIKGK